ncbi:MAG: carboxylating nicotinate-nucleotide diphosphorylase [Chitinophagales bacterium]|jgi:nicotinate-nucleotide pyrophosphorylase (carboxylating)|nr:carboxylating nicotinate-nucleotide diphosphorylase [Chitinophagales bacterium]|tara:strand:+ start:16610 stop:17470 length:861 start_codon:yes stop_codon:yes gene_type:complete
MTVDKFIDLALQEDLQDPKMVIPYGDHTSRATVKSGITQKARALIKQNGVVAGIALAKQIFQKIDPNLNFQENGFQDGDKVNDGDEVFFLEGSSMSILTGERLALNFMQRMSGIATLSREYVNAVAGTGVKILDTRKTTPNLRYFEKWAVKIGGAENHRFGLYDMIMIKDNHIDFAGGIEKAIDAANDYLEAHNFTVPIEIETRSFDDVQRVINHGGVQRIMLDNFSVNQVFDAIDFIAKRVETEVSGGINLDTIRAYAEAQPDFISVGALTHSYTSLDISLKAML